LKRSKSGKKAKRKGSGFERKISKFLKEMWPDGEFERTPMSGGSQLRKGWKLAGDIVTTSLTFPFCVECKKQEKWRLEGLHLRDNIINKWWHQALDESRLVGKKPLLIFSRNHSPIYAAIRTKDWPRETLKYPAFFIKTPKFIVFLFEEIGKLYEKR